MNPQSTVTNLGPAGSRSWRARRVVGASAALAAGVLILTGCGGSSPAASPSASASGITQLDGRAVSVDSKELVMRTADGERTFAIKPEDESAVGPEHIQSHMGIDTLGFRVYYVSKDGKDYAVSVEEIKGSTLGFD